MRDVIAAILGSSFSRDASSLRTTASTVETPWGPTTLHRLEETSRRACVIFRHGNPHRWLPHQIPYRAHAWALREVGCGALLVTSSVGVLDRALPLFQPLLVSDLVMLENRLPDGSPCTSFLEAGDGQGHLVLTEGLFSADLSEQIRRLATEAGHPPRGEVVFGYAPGPRTKTRAENRLWSILGAQVNSMTLGPEVVLANELEIPCAGLVVGHKRSLEDAPSADSRELAESLEQARVALQAIVARFLERGRPVPFRNQIHRFETGS